MRLVGSGLARENRLVTSTVKVPLLVRVNEMGSSVSITALETNEPFGP